MSNYLEEMQNEKVVTINPKKQIVIDKSDLDFIYKQKADLEAKFSEMTEKYNACQEARKLEAEFNSKDKNELKQQLAEKDKEIKKLNLEAQKYYEDAYCNDFQKQTKIDYAVEQLERVKEELNGAFSFSVQQDKFDNCIDNQIKQLKEGK